MTNQKYTKTWMAWLIGYPVFLIGRLAIAHHDAKEDVRDFLNDLQPR